MKLILPLLLLSSVLLLAGCGGGGGEGGSNNSNAQTESTPTPDARWDTMQWDQGEWL